MKIEFTLDGVSPLLQHRFIADVDEATRPGQKPTKAEEVERALYRDANGTIYVPGDSIRASMMGVASDFKLRGKKTYKDTVSGGVIVTPNTKLKPQSYTVDSRGVRIGMARIVRHRPRWDTWTVTGTMDILDDDLSASVARQILERAGRKSGIGDNRKNGFGRFEVVEFTVLKE